jgi:hypothetical protein
MKKKKLNHVVSLRLFVVLLILLTEIVFLNYMASAGVEVVLSSMAVTIALLIQLRFGIRSNVNTPADIAVFIFNWLFLDLAPKIQLISMPQQLVNTSTVYVDKVAITNLLCALFMVTFTLCYAFLTKRSDVLEKPAAARTAPQIEFTGGAVMVTLFVCILVVGAAAPFAYRSADAMVISPATLVVNRFLLFVPSAALLILLNETIGGRRQWLFSRVCAIGLLLVLVLISENPYTEKRNALGPLYLGVLLIAFRHWFSSHTRRMLLLVVSMVLVFPAIALFTHNHQQTLGNLSMSDVGDQIQQYYFSINYDSWANIYTSVEIVKVHGLQWGHQLLGSLLFFVPSSLWTTKPLATGIFLGDYLISNYSMWFNNLSAPLVAEGYLDFGYLGVVGYAGVIAVLVVFLNKLALKANWMALPMAVYGSIFLMFLLRGSLMIAMGFASAAFLSFCFAFVLLSMKLRVQRRRSTGRQFRADPNMAS